MSGHNWVAPMGSADYACTRCGTKAVDLGINAIPGPCPPVAAMTDAKPMSEARPIPDDIMECIVSNLENNEVPFRRRFGRMLIAEVQRLQQVNHALESQSRGVAKLYEDARAEVQRLRGENKMLLRTLTEERGK